MYDEVLCSKFRLPCKAMVLHKLSSIWLDHIEEMYSKKRAMGIDIFEINCSLGYPLPSGRGASYLYVITTPTHEILKLDDIYKPEVRSYFDVSSFCEYLVLQLFSPVFLFLLTIGLIRSHTRLFQPSP
jgi:hypothetical protein